MVKQPNDKVNCLTLVVKKVKRNNVNKVLREQIYKISKLNIILTTKVDRVHNNYTNRIVEVFYCTKWVVSIAKEMEQEVTGHC